ncbi:Osmotically-inducible protein OsmY, contains BON domain [Chitinophaga sp. CF118]|uniref:BON domain-containing protein n=1 Tax=Chitinophaga sp. CF118 TaxID=1884367 RepID=UPI0008F34436|nr:BON domain-containing protein [Chitinophaga sp. CF118]SFE73184.1 Osmotically-inducible protein OsmY, contains BON domain [Chitinophaga sp. CF118]
MRNRYLLMAGLLFTAVSLFSCQPSDSTIQQGVNEKLASTPGITGEVSSGVVTLSGEVSDDAAKTSAEESVKSVSGVKSVTNNVMVQAAVPTPTPPPAAALSPDDMLKNTLDSAYKADGYAEITVAVNNGEVTLEGNAKKADVKKIVKTAEDAKAKKVNNKLTVK